LRLESLRRKQHTAGAERRQHRVEEPLMPGTGRWIHRAASLVGTPAGRPSQPRRGADGVP
jgi:hypothetical protein